MEPGTESPSVEESADEGPGPCCGDGPVGGFTRSGILAFVTWLIAVAVFPAVPIPRPEENFQSLYVQWINRVVLLSPPSG